MLRRFPLATSLVLSLSIVLIQPIAYAAKIASAPAVPPLTIDRMIDKVVSGPFVGPVSKPTRGLYLKATPDVLRGRFRVEVLQKDEIILTEKLVIPASVTKATAVVFLAHVGDILDRLRKADAAAPGTVTVRVTKDGQPFVESSLTAFDVAGAAVRPREKGKSRFAISGQSECTDSCDEQYTYCLSYCDQRSNECAQCWDTYENCIDNNCGCNTWHEVSRTKIGGSFTGAFGFQGLWWCRVTSYYTVEEANDGECAPNRFVCDTDTVTFFCCSYEPNEGDCCKYTDPQDISHSDFCGGEICP